LKQSDPALFHALSEKASGKPGVQAVGTLWIEEQGWVTRDEQQAIKDAAQSVEVAGFRARHARVPAPKDPPSLAEARLLVAIILVKFLDLK